MVLRYRDTISIKKGGYEVERAFFIGTLPSIHKRRLGRKCGVIYFRVQTSSSHTTLHPQSHVWTPITGSSTPHRRHPLVMS